MNQYHEEESPMLIEYNLTLRKQIVTPGGECVQVGSPLSVNVMISPEPFVIFTEQEIIHKAMERLECELQKGLQEHHVLREE